MEHDTKTNNPSKFLRYLLKLTERVERILFGVRIILRIKIFKREFDYRKDDIFIVTYMKSGTTLLQMLVYQLLTDGNMDFRHIYDVSPWLERCIATSKSLQDVPSPRILKSHAPHETFPAQTNGRIIYCIRNGADVAVSMYNHYKDIELYDKGWQHFMQQDFARNSWFRHVDGWLKNKRHLNVLYIQYEDLTRNKKETIQKIAAFLGVKLSAETCQRVLERCSFEFMKLHEEKFGAEKPASTRQVFDRFIRKGESGKGQLEFDAGQVKWYSRLYDKYLAKYNLGYELPAGKDALKEHGNGVETQAPV
jgi:Sulfotransferase domain